ncbi:hypothetical protein SAMD00019534_097560 [Acytostelium subglobosum LB1]|uniref:hypothetical protein n=1 Tax=Acytostelium subglobosum LB1 TaxID=1410327 RepID=UPI0006451493|nr:hypothetical protein SAMD00019534_097560 [Acytostelium subglobosum LB1]GAM26581.1 hypothetical protein SAMD00019534_097560 [Acytostelium subglobosum LB1]|eukprot:XP_012750677.1 hypothetical protein SAMD00019534_097560 [Acytostelium subglobosum LB1]
MERTFIDRHLCPGNSDAEGLPDGANAFRINIDDLEFGPEIGKGAYGKIFKGEYFGTPVGIKEISLSPKESHYKDMVKFIQREVAMLRFSHPNLVQFIGIAERAQCIYIVTEFVAGGDLAYYLFKNKESNTLCPTTPEQQQYCDRLVNKRMSIGGASDTLAGDNNSTERLVNMSWPLRIKIAYDVACAMTYLHSRQVIHRDLKSTNLLVGESWRIKVCDFGFARTASPLSKAKRMTICGTDNWMAPEVMLGEDYNQACDVFSYGIVLAEIITRLEITGLMRPFSLKYGLDVDVLLPLIPRDCPPPFLKLALDCTEYDPLKRPTFKEITERLKSLTKRLSPASPILPPLRILAQTPLSSPLLSPRLIRRRQEAASPLSICDDESDIESDDESSYHLELEGGGGGVGCFSGRFTLTHSNSSGNLVINPVTKRMGYICTDIEVSSITPPYVSSPNRQSPVHFSPASISSATTSKSPSPSNLSPSLNQGVFVQSPGQCSNNNSSSSSSSSSSNSNNNSNNSNSNNNSLLLKSPKARSPLRHIDKDHIDQLSSSSIWTPVVSIGRTALLNTPSS